MKKKDKVYDTQVGSGHLWQTRKVVSLWIVSLWILILTSIQQEATWSKKYKRCKAETKWDLDFQLFLCSKIWFELWWETSVWFSFQILINCLLSTLQYKAKTNLSEGILSHLRFLNAVWKRNEKEKGWSKSCVSKRFQASGRRITETLVTWVFFILVFANSLALLLKKSLLSSFIFENVFMNHKAAEERDCLWQRKSYLTVLQHLCLSMIFFQQAKEKENWHFARVVNFRHKSASWKKFEWCCQSLFRNQEKRIPVYHVLTTFVWWKPSFKEV